jgi:hypothetical protein
MSSTPYPCPCCGYLVFDDPPGSYDICPICNWEDELYQLENPEEKDLVNHGVSLAEAQINFEQMGASFPTRLNSVRKPLPSEGRDILWRKYERQLDCVPSFLESTFGWQKIWLILRVFINYKSAKHTFVRDSEPYYWRRKVRK